MNEESHLLELNSRQKEAVMDISGALLILAGAGAGKTKTITHRILHIVKSGTRPSAVLAITFTNKAASEMRERVRSLLLSDASLNRPASMDEMPFVSTFHSLGVRIIKENCEMLGLPRHFSIFDRGDSKSAIKTAMANEDLNPKEIEPGKVLNAISRLKGDGINAEMFAAREEKSFFEEICARVWLQYEKILAKEKALDFDDLLLKTLWLLRKDEVANKYWQTWKYIHIDEYQDTNKVQYDIAKRLAEKSGNIAVVGDIDQSIYSWRGADFKNIMRFEKDYLNAKTILLEENYRSTKTILAAANAVIAKNIMRKDKNLFTSNADGEQISLYIAFDERDEAGTIAEKADSLIRSGISTEEIAVLYRANFQSRAIEEAFIRRRISYELLGTKFFERKEVKDTLSYIKAALNPDSLSDLKRIINTPARGIGKVTMLKVFEGKEHELPAGTKDKIVQLRQILAEIKSKAESVVPSEAVKFAIKRSGLEQMLQEDKVEGAERLENVRELVTTAGGYDMYGVGDGMEKFLEHAALASDQDDMGKAGGVKLMTVHASKGLEFAHVFVSGLEQDLFPHEKMGEGDSTLEEKEEERRLFYVALTRAKEKLHLSYAQTRTIYGSRQVNAPSEFLADIDDPLMHLENPEAQKMMQYIDF
ncbi:MAG: UvrD-helicase domain-containing protein [Patescibacteria group bacterium]